MSKGEKQHHMVMMDTPPPTAPPPAQQLNVMALPSYGEAVSGPVPLAGPTVAPPVIQKFPGPGLPGVEFGSEPVQLSCWSCHRQVTLHIGDIINYLFRVGKIRGKKLKNSFCFIDCDGRGQWDHLIRLVLCNHLLPLRVLVGLLFGGLPPRL